MDKRAILQKLDAVSGEVGFYYRNLVTGESFGKNENRLFESASVIKLPIYAVIMKLQAEGKLDLSEKLLCRDEDKKPSCGALFFFTGEVEADIRTLCNLMIVISDNTATNLLIRRLGMDFLNAQFREIGLKETRIERYLFDAEAGARGLQNRIVPAEIGGLLEKIANRTFVSAEVSETMENLLRRQQIKHKIRGYLPRDIAVASKTGDDDGITNDVGIVFAREPFVVCFVNNKVDVPTADIMIREVSLMLVQD